MRTTLVAGVMLTIDEGAAVPSCLIKEYVAVSLQEYGEDEN